jgi:erythromycin esterase
MKNDNNPTLNLLNLLFFTIGFQFAFGQGKTVSTVDFSKLKNHEIIAFGEASHGSKSDYMAREELITSLLQYTDSLDILVEMPYYAGIAIKDYSAGLIDTSALIEELMYYGLSTDGFIHLINRFKDDKRVTFYGIDMQTHLSPLKLLKKSLIEVLPELETKITTLSDTLNHDFMEEYDETEYPKHAATIHNCMEQLNDIIHSNESLLKGKFLEIQFPFLIIQQYMGLLDGYKTQTKKHYFDYVFYRDSCMAGNVNTLKAYSKKQIVLIAANAHIDKNKSADGKWMMMGERLNQKFHEQYFAIGSQYVEGTLLEVQFENGVRSIVVNPILPIKRTLPYDLNRLFKPKNDTLIFTAGAQGKLKQIVSKKSHFQNFGTSRYNEKRSSYLIAKIGEIYDAIYLIQKVEASTYLK